MIESSSYTPFKCDFAVLGTYWGGVGVGPYQRNTIRASINDYLDEGGTGATTTQYGAKGDYAITSGDIRILAWRLF